MLTPVLSFLSSDPLLGILYRPCRS